MELLDKYGIPDTDGYIEALVKNPFDADTVIRTIYHNEFVTGNLVVAGVHSRELYPRLKEDPIHFQKLVNVEKSYSPQREYRMTEFVSERQPDLCPKPLAAIRREFELELKTEYIPGSTIRSRFMPYGFQRTLREQSLPLAPLNECIFTNLWGMMQETLASAMSLHDMERVHGDLHMHNVIITPNNEAVLIDFENMGEVADPNFYDLDLMNIKSCAARLRKQGKAMGIPIEDCALNALCDGAKHADPEISYSPRKGYTAADVSI